MIKRMGGATDKNEKMKQRDRKIMSRRSFLNYLWFGLVIVIIGEIIALLIAFFKPKEKKKSAENIIAAGHITQFDVGTVTANIRAKLYICRLDDGGFLALSNECTHLGCVVPWMDEKGLFVCPCHGSTFGISGGVVTGPAPRPLDSYRVFIENDIVKVDINQRVKRSGFYRSQLVYARRIGK